MCCKWYKWTVPWLRQLVDRLSLQRPMFSSIPVHEGFVVDHVALGQVFLRLLLPPPLSVLLTQSFVYQRCLLTYLVTPWCRFLLEKLTGLQPVKKFPTFHGTQRFITVLTSVHHLSLSWASPIQSLLLDTLPSGDPSGGVVYLRIVYITDVTLFDSLI